MVNPCIVGKDGRIEGCVTPCVMDGFISAFHEVCELCCGDSRNTLPPEFEQALISLSVALKDSLNTGSPAFLNNLRKLVYATKDISNAEFWKKLRSVHRGLVEFCRSKAVKDEVLGMTIRLFEQTGFRYQGSNVQGIAKDECLFEFDGIRVGVKIRDYHDMFAFWKEDGVKQATVYCAGRRYAICEQSCEPERFIKAIAACISDDDAESCEIRPNSEMGVLAQSLIEIANMILNGVEK